MEYQSDVDLGMTQRRDPDALPPSSAFETAMYWVHHALAALGHGNCVFAIKAGLLTGNVFPTLRASTGLR